MGKPGVEERSAERKAHVRVCRVPLGQCVLADALDALERWRARDREPRTREVRLLERGDSTGAKRSPNASENRNRIGDVHEDQPAHRGIERPGAAEGS